MKDLMKFVDGNKSYLVAVAAVLYGVYMGVWGDMSTMEAVNYVLGGGALAAVRSAMKKLEGIV